MGLKHQVRLGESDGQFGCREEQNLLQGMRTFQLGVPMLEAIPVGCRGGGCGVCRIRVLSGEYETQKMSRKHVTAEEQEQGVALACRVYPRSDLDITLFPVETSP